MSFVLGIDENEATGIFRISRRSIVPKILQTGVAILKKWHLNGVIELLIFILCYKFVQYRINEYVQNDTMAAFFYSRLD